MLLPTDDLIENPTGYFLYHSIGQYPDKAEQLSEAMREFGSIWGAPDDKQWGYVLQKRQDFIDYWRRIIQAPKGSLTTCESVTSGFHTLLRSLPENSLKGKRVLVAADCFPSLHFLLAGLADRMGYTLETVALDKDNAWVESENYLEHWGPDVGLALITWVTSTASKRCDLDELVAHGRSMGSIIGVDITQAAGLLPFSVMAPKIDFALSTSLKWMCGTPGAGILYVDKSHIADWTPEIRGWFSQNNPFSWDLDKFAYAPDVRRFDSGTPGSVAAIASLPALRWHSEQDHAQLAAHTRKLVDHIILRADELGLPLQSPRDDAQRGGSVMMRMPDKADAAAVVGALGLEGFSTDCRGLIFRMSPGYLTHDDAVNAVFDNIKIVMNRRRRRFAGAGLNTARGNTSRVGIEGIGTNSNTTNPPLALPNVANPNSLSETTAASSKTLDNLGALLLSGKISIVDCTGTLGPNTPILKLPEDFARNTPKVEINKISEYDEDGPFFAWNWLKLGEHSGTHFDAPRHWISGKDFPDGFTDTLAVQRLIAPVNVIDCSAEATADADFLLTAKAVKAWEDQHGEINPGEWVVMRTDWDKLADDEALFLNEDPDPHEDGSHSPGPTPECIDYLLSKGIVGWGTQCIGTDAGMAGKMSPPYPAHNLLHRDNCFGLASLTNLDQLPPKGAILLAAPLKIEKGTGSPIRALALVPSSM